MILILVYSGSSPLVFLDGTCSKYKKEEMMQELTIIKQGDIKNAMKMELLTLQMDQQFSHPL